MSQSLEKYEAAVRAVKKHQDDNFAVFSHHNKLFLNVVDAENELRDYIAEAKINEKGSTHEVTYLDQKQEVVDMDKLKSYLPIEKYTEIVTINQRPPRITIKELR